MKIPNRFRSEGRVATGVIILLIIGALVFLFVFLQVEIDKDPNGYIILFCLAVTYDFGVVLVVAICLFIPPVSCL